MLRDLGQFVYNLISGTAVHVISMLLGFILTLILFGKTDESIFHLVVAVFVPFLASGAFIAHRRLRWAPLVCVLSGTLALTVPPIAISAYWGWSWSTLGSDYWWVLTAVPCSLLGCLWVQSTPSAATQSELPGSSHADPNAE
ncbi:hypothetical protein Pan97_23280 [Bremerella volcania]|uniref:Uncharacterized protein n=1 Tax=Bremerella volcania TaxID=2527984 RepID=A0A518C7V3_9BACT|nr:hypothetical protein [Bremerella volcania]QDU75298.1 hypothetical protein Pan97_23280 [Bremerella volcania]